jgi:polygalacturonase
MNTECRYKVVLFLAALFGLAFPVHATVLLDQTSWTTANRRTQNLPTTSAWFASSTGSLTVSGTAMRMVVGTGSGMAMTYFTPLSNSPPVVLNVGDTLTATFTFTFSGIPTPGSSSQGFKFGLFDFADGSNVPLRVSSDSSFSSSGEGLNVAGYSLFGKMYQTFADTSPIDIRKRTTISDTSLMGSSADWTSLTKGGTNSLFQGFTNSTPYSLQFVLQRTSLTAMAITETWSNFSNGATISVSTTDSAATSFSFDGIAYRPQNNTEAPLTNLFQEVKVEVTSAPVAPSIVTDLTNQTVSSGQTVNFTVVPNGTLPLSYQWYFNTNSFLTNTSIPTLTLTNVQVTDAGGYSVIVSNSFGSATGMVATLTVNLAAPTITSQPQDEAVFPTGNATFTVAAVGSEPFTYQWYFNNTTLLSNETDSTLTLTNVQPGDDGLYSVLVSNPVGSVMSSNAVLTVNTNPVAPFFTTQPVPVSAVVGDSVSFTAVAVGTLPISYQWNTNGVPLPGATSSNLNLANIQLGNAGNYSVTASNSVGTTNSNIAVLTVTPKMPPPLPVIPTNQFVITDFGAIGDGVTNNAVSIQNTISAASAAGGGIVVVPVSGNLSNYLSGPITMANNINLQVNAGATLKMLPRASWPSLLPPFITGSGLHDVEISGSGTIDGNAGFGSANWWPNLDTAHRPDFINFDTSTTRILIQGVTLQNPPAFHLMLKGNNVSVTIQNITINTPGNSPNTDGMDLASTNVLIQNCSISDGDDNIEIGGSGAAADITVSNCTFGVGHGLSVGSITQGGVHNILVSNCTFVGTDYGIRMKSDRDIGGLVQNLVYRDITMTNVGYPIAIYSYYDTVGTPNVVSPSSAAANAAQPIVTLTPIWQNILISNVTATSSTGGGSGGIIWGRQEMLVSNVTLIDVNMQNPADTFSIYNAQAIQIIDSQLTAPTSTNTLTLYNAQVTVTNGVVNTNVVTLGGLAISPTNNVVSFFNTLAAITDTKLLGTGSITLSGSTLTFTQAAVTFSNSFSVSSTSTLAMTSGSNTFSSSFSGTGALTLNLPATSRLTLQTDSSGFNGPLVVSNSGTLLVNNTTGSGTGIGVVTVVGGAILGGGGIIGGPVIVNGILAPGNSPGTLTVSNNLVVNGSGLLQYELGTTSDQTVVGGNLVLGGTLNVIAVSGFTNNTYTLFTYGGTLTYNGVSIGTTPAGHNYAIDTSIPGRVNLNVTPPLTAFQQWQILYFGSTNNPSADPNADPDGDGQNNLAEFLSGTNPTNSASGLRIVSASRQSNDVVITWTTSGGVTNAVQATAGNGSGGYATNFADISNPIIISGSGDATTNYTDSGGATNSPSRYYRVRLVP